MQKIKYITNRELLLEIQRSKATYCHFTAPEYVLYDTIVTSTETLTPEFITTALQTKIAKMVRSQTAIDDVTSADVVFRVMSDTHLPEEVDEKRRKRSSSGGWIPRTNFPPFQHYVLHDDSLIEVGRSHWKGDFENGQFSAIHGKITNRLATMFLLLVEQYSKRGNWRSYCCSDDTEALTQRGWLNMDEITEDDIILSYHEGQLKWSTIKSIYRDDFDGKMFRLTVTGMDALVTEGHRFVTQDGLRPVEYLRERDRIVLTGQPVADGDGRYSDAFVKLVGWAVTEGCYYLPKDRNYHRVTISQNEGVHAESIRACIAQLTDRHGECLKEAPSGHTMINFQLPKVLCQRILEVAPDRVLSMPFIMSLTQAQRELLIDTMIDGDGWRTGDYRRYCQKDKRHVDSFLALCTLAGHRVSCRLRQIESYGKPTTIHIMNMFSGRCDTTTVESIDFHGGKRNGRNCIGHGKTAHPNEPTVDYQGRIWCPETEYGSFMARRNGYIFLTGNSYVMDMRGQALVQLSQVGLQFDESRGDNPFAWYTQIVKNSFRRILLLEKRTQDIRDDLLTIAGAMPSFTRQVDDEIEQKAMNDPVGPDSRTEPKELKKRGRKPKVVE